MLDFDRTIEKFKNKELDITKWNFCTHREGNGRCGAYIMGEGSEQCLASKHNFGTEQEVIDFFKSLGATRILPI